MRPQRFGSATIQKVAELPSLALGSNWLIGNATDCAVEVGFACDGVVNPAHGVRGGGPGVLAKAYLRRASGEREALPGSSHLMVAEGESLVSLTAGGGGYGSRLDRALERVAHDVAEGWISPERARNVYGVEVTSEGAVDRERTERLRGGLAAA